MMIKFIFNFSMKVSILELVITVVFYYKGGIFIGVCWHYLEKLVILIKLLL